MSRFSKRLVIVGFWVVLGGAAGCSSSAPAIDLSEPEGGTKEKDKEAAVQEEKPGAPFRLPGDQTGKILAKVLPPTPPPPLLRNPTPPAPPPGPRMPLRLPETSLPSGTSEVLRLPIAAGKGLSRPDFVLEETLDESFGSPIVPKIPSFATGRRSQVASEDVAIPPMLPLMATPLSARVSLEDPTQDASTAVVLSAKLPARSTPVPFVRQTRPEPYENKVPLTLLVPEDRATPQTPTPELKR
jgi:hypothetical protein